MVIRFKGGSPIMRGTVALPMILPIVLSIIHGFDRHLMGISFNITSSQQSRKVGSNSIYFSFSLDFWSGSPHYLYRSFTTLPDSYSASPFYAPCGGCWGYF